MRLRWLHDMLGLITGRLAAATQNRSIRLDDANRERRLGTKEQQSVTLRNGHKFVEHLANTVDDLD